MSQVDSSGATYALTDGLGSVRGLTDASATLSGTASYDVFGAPRAASGAASAIGFAGEPSDGVGAHGASRLMLIEVRCRS